MPEITPAPALRVWRLTTARHAGDAFSGEGARLYGGRWNHKGVPLVYVSATLSLAMLEMLVQDPPLAAHYVARPADIPALLPMQRLTPADLPADWRLASGRPALQRAGSDWATHAASAVLAVPSAVIPDEFNYLLNPLHPDFRRIGTGAAQSLDTDLRLLRPAPGTPSRP